MRFGAGSATCNSGRAGSSALWKHDPEGTIYVDCSRTRGVGRCLTWTHVLAWACTRVRAVSGLHRLVKGQITRLGHVFLVRTEFQIRTSSINQNRPTATVRRLPCCFHKNFIDHADRDYYLWLLPHFVPSLFLPLFAL